MDPQDQEPHRILERGRSPAGLKDAVAFQYRPLETLERRRRIHGPVFPLTSLVAGRMLVIGTPDLAHEILHAQSGTYLAGAANRRILPVLPEDTVLTLDGRAHLERRHRLARFFHGDAPSALAPAVREIASREIEGWPLGVPFAVLPRMRFLTREPEEQRSSTVKRTQAQIADELGLGRQAISRILGELVRQRLVERRRGRVVIADREQLRRLAFPHAPD